MTILYRYHILKIVKKKEKKMNPFGSVKEPPSNIGGAETTPEQEDLAKQKALDYVESKFRKGMALHTEGYSRPCQYSPEQMGWDAAQSMEMVKVGFLSKAREEFGI